MVDVFHKQVITNPKNIICFYCVEFLRRDVILGDNKFDEQALLDAFPFLIEFIFIKNYLLFLFFFVQAFNSTESSLSTHLWKNCGDIGLVNC
jgi:hypothetical protein